MNIPKQHKLTITSGYTNETMTLDFAPDSDVEDMKEIFALVMKFLTFADQEWLEHSYFNE
jgi:hypothetical protein